ncbi:MAG: 6-bladed beta-propeller [Gemmatimonadota bacterium]
MKRRMAAACLLTVVIPISAQQAPRLSATPTLAIGTLDGPETTQLSRVYGAIRLPNATIAIGNSATSDIRFFDANGKYLRTVSRAGSGPGEFHEYSSVVFYPFGPDQLYMPDGGNGRINVFSTDGTYRRSFRLEAPSAAGMAGIAAIAGREIVGLTSRNAALRGAPGARIDATHTYAIFDSTGRLVRPLFDVASRSRIVHAHRGITHYPFVPFAPEALVAARGERIFLLRNTSPEIEVWSRSGQRTATYRWATARIPVRSIWPRFKVAELAMATRERDKVLYGHYYETDLPLPEYVPVASRLLVASDESLWIERFRLPWTTTRTWDVLDRNGRYLGVVETPDRLDVYQVGSDFVLGRWRDSSDVEHVHVYGLRR